MEKTIPLFGIALVLLAGTVSGQEKAAAGAVLAEGPDAEAAIRDLSSPFREVREEGVGILAEAGESAGEFLRAAYPAADFRTKALILGALARGHPAGGVELVLSDLSGSDRGVVLAQRRLVSALYGHAREIVRINLQRIVRRGDWRTEEALRALPAPIATAHRALRDVAGGLEGKARSAWEVVLDAVTAVDGLREGLRSARKGGTPQSLERIREIERLLLRHDTERALLAVLEAGGSSGNYDGMFSIVGELVRKGEADPRSILLFIVRDEDCPEAGVPARKDYYEYVEPLPPWLFRKSLRGRAAMCLGEIGDERVAGELLEWFAEIQKGVVEQYNDERWAVAYACAALGEEIPLRTMIGQYSEELASQGMWGAWIHSALAGAFNRLGELSKAKAHFLKYIESGDSSFFGDYNLACVLARMGKIEEALDWLANAVGRGYGLDPENIAWMQRDRDLEPLWNHPRFGRILRAAIAESVR